LCAVERGESFQNKGELLRPFIKLRGKRKKTEDRASGAVPPCFVRTIVISYFVAVAMVAALSLSLNLERERVACTALCVCKSFSLIIPLLHQLLLLLY